MEAGYCQVRSCLFFLVPYIAAYSTLLFSSFFSPNAGTMFCQRRRRWPNNVPALGKRLLFATSWKGTVLLYRVYRPAYQTR